MIKKIILSSLVLIFLVVGLGAIAEINSFSPTIKSLEINSPISIGLDNYFVMSIIAESNYSEIASVEATVKSYSKEDAIKINLRFLNQSWYSSFSVPSDFEGGVWSVEEIIFKDSLGTIKKYYSSEINKTFVVSINSLQTSSETTIVEQKKQACIQSGGTWDDVSFLCSCQLNYQLQDSGYCLYSPTTLTTNGCVFNYSEWSPCSASGTKTRTVLSSTNCSSTDQPVLTQACDYLPTTLATNSCVFNYSEWSPCSASGTKTRTVLSSTNCSSTDQPVLTQACDYLPTTLTTNGCVFNYSEWSPCSASGTKTRTVLSSTNCSSTDQPVLTQTCESLPTTLATNSCVFNYSEWSPCSASGTKTRTVLSSTNCSSIDQPVLIGKCEESSNGEEELEDETLIKENIDILPKVPCIFTYSDWSPCQSSGTQSRKLISKMPANCSEGEPILARDCKYVPAVSVKEYINPSEEKVTEIENVSENSSDNNLLIQEEKIEEDILPTECLKARINNKEECEVYIYQSKIVPECLSLNLGTLDQCRNYFLTNYGKPLKCEGVNEKSCNDLIDNVILFNLKSKISEEKINELVEVSGKKALIVNKEETVTLEIKKSEDEQKKISVENLPIIVSKDENIPIILLSIETNSSQQGISPVAIALSSGESNLPDDVIKRIGENFDVESLSGVDKAIVNAKPLEQPKYNPSVGESLSVNLVETVKNNNEISLKVEGKALPNQVITLFIYSSMPIVVTVQADQDGNWVYSLDKSMVDGTHEVYAVLHNEEGKIVESSAPKAFFIEEAQAATLDEFFISEEVVNQAPDEAGNMLNLYLLGGLSTIIILISLLLIIKERFGN